MKKAGFFLVPLISLLFLSFLVPRILAGGMTPSSMIVIAVALILFMALFRPKRAATRTADAVAQDVLDDYCKDAFADSEQLNARFHAALHDIGSNCPKAAVSKLEKLAPQCTTDRQIYAVAMATALAYKNQKDLKNAIREYNKAVVLHPTGKLAYAIGDAHHRMGNLDKARDSYEFAMELEPGNAQYPSSIGTICVGEGNYNAAIRYATDALALDENFSQALATLAICYGVKDNDQMHQRYLELATKNGYSEEKILTTIKALKKRS